MQVELRDGGGCVAVFGLAFFVSGLFATLAGLGIVPLQNASQGSRLVLFLMGLPFLGIGGALAFGRRRTVFDASQGRVIRWWSLVIPIRRKERSLNEFTGVLLAVESDSDSVDGYPVRLRARTGKDLAICSSPQFGESRGRAEFLARFLHLDLVDRSTDHELVLSPERAGETLQERLRAGHLQPEREVRPMAMRSEVDESAGQVRLVIPGYRWGTAPFAIGAAIPIAIALSLVPTLTRNFHRTGAPHSSQLVLLAGLIFCFGFLPLLGVIYGVLSSVRSRTVVTASRTGILIDRHGIWRTRSTLIPADAILALDYSTVDSILDSAAYSVEQDARKAGKAVSNFSSGAGGSRVFAAMKKWVPSKGIIVKSRLGLFVFGEGLPGEELRYLQSIIARALADF